MSCWILEEKNDALTRITFHDDPFHMNWVNEAHLWGKMTAPDGIRCCSERTILSDDSLEETYTFINESAETVSCQEGGASIALPLNDNYLAADVCLPLRCHAHVWCGGEVSWVLALRMGGQAPHLGMLLMEGALGSYSIHRSLTESHCVSNTRGVFLLHPKSFSLGPGQKQVLRWRLFRHEGIEDWHRILKKHLGPLLLTSDQWVAFQHEAVKWSGGTVDTSRTGEVSSIFQANGKTTTASWRVMLPAQELLRRRALFITERQQCTDPNSRLYGAYLIYDRETGEQCYSHEIPDHNSARERMGMGVLVALALRCFPDDAMEESLRRYADFILREVYEEKTHTVYDDAGYAEERHRLYNEPWAAVFFMELYRLFREPVWIRRAADVMERYYQLGGNRFYAIGIPMTDIVSLLAEAGLNSRAEELRRLFIGHAESIAATGVHYPTSEVDYEQSIVAPAVNMLLMGYQLSGKKELLTAAGEQMDLLILFQGMQPDYHLNEVAIRHWDGYWFGKRSMLGDTFPHYWSSLSGLAFERYGRITGKKEWLDRAERNLRGSLPLFFEDGSASCAMVYPRSVNGEPAHFYDPWANDQDWGLYYYFQRN